jgi:hypothetical protein
MIDREFVDAIDRLAVQAAQPNTPREMVINGINHLITFDSDRRAMHFELPPPPLQVTATSLEGLCQAFNSFAGGYCHEGDKSRARAHVNASAAAISFDAGDADGRRLSGIQFNLKMSRAFASFSGHGEIKATPKELIDQLRTVYANMEGTSGLVEILRHVKFVEQQQSEQSTTQGRESMGASVTMDYSSQHGDFPEELEVRLPVFENCPDLKADMRLVVIVDTKNKVVRLVAKAGSCRAAQYEVLTNIATSINRLTNIASDHIMVGAAFNSGVLYGQANKIQIPF